MFSPPDFVLFKVCTLKSRNLKLQQKNTYSLPSPMCRWVSFPTYLHRYSSHLFFWGEKGLPLLNKILFAVRWVEFQPAHGLFVVVYFEKTHGFWVTSWRIHRVFSTISIDSIQQKSQRSNQPTRPTIGGTSIPGDPCDLPLPFLPFPVATPRNSIDLGLFVAGLSMDILFRELGL